MESWKNDAEILLKEIEEIAEGEFDKDKILLMCKKCRKFISDDDKKGFVKRFKRYFGATNYDLPESLKL